MTTIDTHPETAAAASAAPTGAGRALASVAAWATTSDHKRIGRLFTAFSLTFLLGVGAIASLLGFERIDTNKSFLPINSLDQLFSLFRVGLVFMVIVPVMLGLAISIVPLQIYSLVGLVVAGVALTLFVYIMFERILHGADAQGVFTLFSLAFFILGVLLLGVGLLGEYVGRIYAQVRGRPRYLVQVVLQKGAELAE